MTMLDEKYKIKFAHHIANLASEQPDDQVVPEYFVENELRKWINDKFLLNPPLQPKINNDDVSELPFNQEIQEGYKIRTFNEIVESEELKWHFDDTDREVTIIESKGWGFQLDNELPVVLKEGDKIFIPKGVYHRVLKGDGNLKIKIKEF
jgi:quercetin dioxygenase-like cupin family protein